MMPTDRRMAELSAAETPLRPEADRPAIGRIIAPAGKEATPDAFYFWAAPEVRIEKTQPVVSDVAYPDGRVVRFYGVVDEVGHVERGADVHTDAMVRSNDPAMEFVPREPATTWAKARVLASDPPAFTPPLAGAAVRHATKAEAAKAYGFDRVEYGAPIGLLRNGATATSAVATVDLDYLLGKYGAHLNAAGISGVAAKTSALLTVVRGILDATARRRRERPSASDNLTVVPVLFNLKGTDLMFIDKWSASFKANPEYAERWREMGVEARPFANVKYLVPAMADNPLVAAPIVNRRDLEAYSWGLADIVRLGLFSKLFSPKDLDGHNFAHVVQMFEDRLTSYGPRGRDLRPRPDGEWWAGDAGTPQTFNELVRTVTAHVQRRAQEGGGYDQQMEGAHQGTLNVFAKRLRLLEQIGKGVLAWDTPNGQPPAPRPGTEAEVFVIDIASLSSSEMQQFVIAAVSDRIFTERTSPHAARGVRYFNVLDELNRYAPSAGSSSGLALTTPILERISAEFRSIGDILAGAEQFASQVSLKVVENASVRLVGRTGPGELSADCWKSLSPADRAFVPTLQQGEMLLQVPTFRAPAHIVLPYPACASKLEDVWTDPTERPAEVEVPADEADWQGTVFETARAEFEPVAEGIRP